MYDNNNYSEFGVRQQNVYRIYNAPNSLFSSAGRNQSNRNHWSRLAACPTLNPPPLFYAKKLSDPYPTLAFFNYVSAWRRCTPTPEPFSAICSQPYLDCVKVMVHQSLLDHTRRDWANKLLAKP